MFLVGIFKHMQETLLASLSTASAEALDKNVRKISLFYTDGKSTFDSFFSLLAKINILTGRGRESLMRMLLVCIKKNVIADDLQRLRTVECFEGIMRIFTTVRGHPSSAEIAWLKVKLPYVMNLIKITLPNQKRSWCFPKFHAMLHLVENLYFWGSLSNVSMNINETYHKHGKTDALHSNNSSTVPLTVALCRASARRLLLARVFQLCHKVPVFKQLLPREDLVQKPLLPLRPLLQKQIQVIKAAWALSSLSALSSISVFDPFEKIMHARAVKGFSVMDGSINAGEAVRLFEECIQSTPLFLVEEIFSVNGMQGVYLLVRELTSSRPPSSEEAEAYAEELDTHVRYIQPFSYTIINAKDVWAKVFTPGALSATGVPVRGAYAFTASLERSGSRF